MSSQKYSGEDLPEEVQLRLLRRTNAEQDRYTNLARIADSLERIADTLGEDDKPAEVDLRRIAKMLGKDKSLLSRLRAWARSVLRRVL